MVTKEKNNETKKDVEPKKEIVYESVFIHLNML